MKRRILALFLIIILLFNVGAMTSCSLLLTQTPGANGADGKDGVDGKDGADGKDGITPMLRINVETNYWEVSYDNGESWSSLGVKATGDLIFDKKFLAYKLLIYDLSATEKISISKK